MGDTDGLKLSESSVPCELDIEKNRQGKVRKDINSENMQSGDIVKEGDNDRYSKHRSSRSKRKTKHETGSPTEGLSDGKRVSIKTNNNSSRESSAKRRITII